MRLINEIYINGAFVKLNGTETLEDAIGIY